MDTLVIIPVFYIKYTKQRQEIQVSIYTYAQSTPICLRVSRRAWGVFPNKFNIQSHYVPQLQKCLKPKNTKQLLRCITVELQTNGAGT